MHLAGGPMTLAIGWPHEVGENLRTWPHEGGVWHQPSVSERIRIVVGPRVRPVPKVATRPTKSTATKNTDGGSQPHCDLCLWIIFCRALEYRLPPSKLHPRSPAV